MDARHLHLLFRGQEYLVREEEDGGGATRVVVFVRGAGAEAMETSVPASGVPRPQEEGPDWLGGLAWGTEAPPDWEPALVHEGGDYQTLEGSTPRDSWALRKVLQAFLSGGERTPARDARGYFQLVSKEGPAFEIARAHTSGLAALVYSTREAAQAAKDARPEGEGLRVEAVADLSIHLRECARTGFAGAILDESWPIYFFLDDDGDLKFLKLAARLETVESTLLDARGEWYPYEGELGIDLLDNQDAGDRLMVERLGGAPFVGYEPGMEFYHLAGDSGPLTMAIGKDLGDTSIVLPLVVDTDEGRAFLKQHGHDLADRVPIGDLVVFMNEARARGVRVVLHPGENRACRAELWADGDSRVILDSYSGFWRLSPSRVATRVD